MMKNTMKKIRNKMIAILIGALLTASLAGVVLADTYSDIEVAKNEKYEAEQSLSDTNTRIDGMRSEKEELEVYLADVNEQLTQISEELTDLNSQIENKKVEIEMAKAAVNRAVYNEETQYADMEIRIQYMYENANTDLLASLLNSESLSDFINRADQIKAITDSDRQGLADYQEARAEVEEHQALLEEEEAALEDLKKAAEEKQKELHSVAESTNLRISEYEASITNEEGEASELRAKIEAQQDLIKELEAKAAAEEEARRKAEEEARRAAELAAKKAAEEEAARIAAEEEAARIAEEERLAAEAAASEEELVADPAEGEEGSSETDENGDTEAAEPAQTEEASESEAETQEESSQGKYLGKFMLTAYCPCAQCCGRANAPTASGVMPKANHTVAMAGVPFGTKLRINGTIYTVEDLGTPYGHVDVFMNSHAACFQFGLQYADVYQVG